MLVDIHTNLGWYPDHYSDEFVEFALAAKKAKMRITPDVYFAGEEEEEKNAFDSTPETLLEATKDCDKGRGVRAESALLRHQYPAGDGRGLCQPAFRSLYRLVFGGSKR